MLQTLFNSRSPHRTPWISLVALLVVSMVSMPRTAEVPDNHVGSKEIRTAEFCPNIILHNQRDKTPDQFGKPLSGILGSVPQAPALQHAARITRYRPEVHAPAFSPLTTTIITSSFL